VSGGGRNLPGPKKRSGELVDLSETGAQIVFGTAERPPDLVTITLNTPSGPVLQMDARVANQRTDEEDRLIVGFEFDDVTPEQRIQLIQLMFTEPDTWVKERFVEDRPLRSAMDVMGSPVLVAFFHLTKRVPVVRHQGQALTSFYGTQKCPACHAVQLDVFDKCGKCGARMPAAEPPAPYQPVGVLRRLGHWTRGVAALPLLGLAGAFAVGWKPIVDPLQSQLASLYQDRVTPTRVGELAGALRQLRVLERQLEWAQLPLAPGLPMDWSKRLWGARYGYELDNREEREWQTVVLVLDEAALALEAAGQAYRDNRDPKELRRELDRADERLENASRELAVAIQDEEKR
jgi:PilZ domain